MPFTRRQFLKMGAGLIMAAGKIPHKKAAYAAGAAGVREAMYYTPIDEESVRCNLCPQSCTLSDGRRGFCRARECRGGKLYSLVYELPCSVHVDPIEKKPVFHMLPASSSFSIATAGCNSRCKFCQNWQISQAGPEETNNITLRCEEVVSKALQAGCRSIAYTYSEPTVFYEYMVDTARLARAKGLKNIWVTGGKINPEPLAELAECVDAANIDFKAFDDAYLRKICAQDLKTIMTTVRLTRKHGMWVELTNLIVPTLNDDAAKMRMMAEWIRDEAGKDVPLHISRFWPMYKLKNIPPTPVSTLERMRETAREAGLEYVYIGNVPGHDGNNTYCPSCGRLLVRRAGYRVDTVNIAGSKCKFCGYRIAGVWQ